MPLIDEEYCKALLAKNERGAQSMPRAAEARPSPNTCEKEGETYRTPSSEDAFKRIIRLSQVRERSAQEMRARLGREDFGEAAVEEAIDKACRCGLIDDGRFAEVLVRSRIRAGKGMKGIAAELERNGIDASLLDDLPDEHGHTLDLDHEVERAIELLNRRPPTAKNKRDAAYRRLIAKGYEVSVASSAARQWLESLE